MLELAVRAGIPVIAAFTRDTINLNDVLEKITGLTPFRYDGTSLQPKRFYVHIARKPVTFDLIDLYSKLVALESVLLIINPLKVEEPMYNAGEIGVPKDLMLHFMNEVVEDQTKAAKLLQGMGGCTLKEAAEFARMTMARDNSFTVAGIMETRKASFQGLQGLTLVDPRQGFYAPPEALSEWVLKEKQFFLTAQDSRLIPRGLLMDGKPGTGKTAASKWIAEQFGVPLYRVDLAGTKNKYVGQSEQNLLMNLSRLDHEEPAVAVFDEIEKVFSDSINDSSGTTSSMLSQLLWWLAERKSRVLVVMTTNNAKALPRELHREGRIDKTLQFDGLSSKESIPFVRAVLSTFSQTIPGSEEKLMGYATAISKQTFGSDKMQTHASQASLTKNTYEYVKGLLSA